MIGFLSGRLVAVADDRVTVDVGGIGYEVHLHAGAMAALPLPGQPLRLFTELEMRNEMLRLYGFLEAAEREWYRVLTTVQGVGGKGALALLGTVGEAGLAEAILLEDPRPLTRAPGVGRKLAERVVRELRGRAPVTPWRQPPADAPESALQSHRDAVSALINLGYPVDTASAAVRAAMAEAGEGDVRIEQILHAALRALDHARG